MINPSRRIKRGRSRKVEVGEGVGIEVDGVVDPEVEVGQEDEDVEGVGDSKKREPEYMEYGNTP